jgi:hypothetical protein
MCAPADFKSEFDFDAPRSPYRVEKYENSYETTLTDDLVVALRRTGHTVTPL